MTRVVEAVVGNYKEMLEYKKVSTKEMAGALRYKEFSIIIKKLIPIPSIVIENKLIFETIPSVEELESSIKQSISNIKK